MFPILSTGLKIKCINEVSKLLLGSSRYFRVDDFAQLLLLIVESTGAADEITEIKDAANVAVNQVRNNLGELRWMPIQSIFIEVRIYVYHPTTLV